MVTSGGARIRVVRARILSSPIACGQEGDAMSLFANSGIATRYFAAPRDWFFTPHDMAEKSALDAVGATRLSAEAVGRVSA